MQRRTFDSKEECIGALAEHLVARIEALLAERDHCSLVLAGGSTPKALYGRLAEEQLATRVDWSRLQVYWGDERCVEAGDPASNFGMAQAALLSKVPIDPSQVHPIQGAKGAAKAAAEYSALLEGVELDLVLLGMGGDGHTASLFPGGAELEALEAAAPSLSPVPPPQRVTLTLPTLNAAGQVLFLVTGTDKAERLQEVRAQLELPPTASTLPAARVRPEAGPALWFGDRAALGH